MAWTATLDSVSKSGNPGTFELGVTYLDSTQPDWHMSTSLVATVDPALTAAQQRAAIVALVTADVQRYKTQATVWANLLSAVGTSINVP